MIYRVNLFEDFNVSIPLWLRKRAKQYGNRGDWANGVWTQLDITTQNINDLKNDDGSTNVRYFARGYDDNDRPFVIDSWSDSTLYVGSKHARSSRISARWLSDHIDEMGKFEYDREGLAALKRKRADDKEGDITAIAQKNKQHRMKVWDHRTGDYVDKWVVGSRSYGDDSRYDKSGYIKPDIRAKYRDKMYELSLGRYASTIDKLLTAYEDLSKCYRHINRDKRTRDRNDYLSLVSKITSTLSTIEDAKVDVDDYDSEYEKRTIIRRIKEVPEILRTVQEFISNVNAGLEEE